jgi:hypothetical protein
MLLSLPRVNSPDGWAPSGFIGKPVEHGVTAGFANLKQDAADEGKYPACHKWQRTGQGNRSTLLPPTELIAALKKLTFSVRSESGD